MRSVDAYGKHLFVRFEGDLVDPLAPAHDGLLEGPARQARRRRAAWLVMRRDGQDVVQLRGPVLELMTESRTRFDQRLAGLGPDILAAELDEAEFLRRLRARRPDARRSATRCSTSGRSPASATCGRARAASRPASTRGGRAGEVSDDEALAIVRETRPRMQESAADGRQDRWRRIYNRAGPAVPALRQAPHPRARHGRRQPTHVLVSELSALRRVGHKGADHIAPGNTAASFDAALAHGVDMIEFDVLPEDMDDRQGSRLLLSHDYDHDLAAALTLEEGLAHLASSPFTSVELDVDLKLPGYEARVVEALRAHDLIERALVSSTFMRSLVAVRALEPRLRLGWSVPRARRDYTASRLWMLPAYAMVARIRRRLPAAAVAPSGRRALRRGDGPLAARLARARAGRRRRGRRAVRVDGRRRGAHPGARGDGRDRRDHERSAPFLTAPHLRVRGRRDEVRGWS